MNAADQLAEVIRHEGARLHATLVRSLGDWSLAEEAVQEAAIAALRDWSRHGIPDHPRAWLIATARRKAVDIIRRERARGGKERDGATLMELTRADEPDESVLDDDMLRLIFTCCHPSLAPEARLALALRTLCQLSVAQVADVMLTSESAMAKRLVRTRQKITMAKIPYRVPVDAELPGRLGRSAEWCTRSTLRGTRRSTRVWCSTSTCAPKGYGWPGSCTGCCPTRPCRPRCSR